MSRMYYNKPLSALPVDNITWKTSWCPSKYQTGPGVIIEGCVKGRSRHVVVSTDCKRTRYMALYVSVRRAHRRRFDASGVEVEPNFSETEKIRTGFLNSSYKTMAKDDDDALTMAELTKLVQPSDLLQLTRQHNRPDCIVLWINDDAVQDVELANDDDVRTRTSGNGPFIETITRLDPATTATTVCNYSGGEQVGASWTDRIMAVKSTAVDVEKTGPPCEDGAGAADDEWDD